MLINIKLADLVICLFNNDDIRERIETKLNNFFSFLSISFLVFLLTCSLITHLANSCYDIRQSTQTISTQLSQFFLLFSFILILASSTHECVSFVDFVAFFKKNENCKCKTVMYQIRELKTNLSERILRDP